MNRDKKRILLIVDDESSVCRALTRMLTSRVDETFYATSAKEAELILNSNPVTHLICDQWFGTGQSLGLELATTWRNRYPSIERIILLTGQDIQDLEAPPEVDGILTKAAEPATIVESLDLK